MGSPVPPPNLSEPPRQTGVTKELEDKILKAKVRIITVALGSSADERLEKLADISEGETHFAPDGGKKII